MKIEIQKTDRFGNSLEIGDQVELFDWGAPSHGQKPLGVVTLVWDEDEGRVSCNPVLVEDPHDFWTKALPNCVKILIGRYNSSFTGMYVVPEDPTISLVSS